MNMSFIIIITIVIIIIATSLSNFYLIQNIAGPVVCCKLPATPAPNVQYHNPFSELLEKPFWILCPKNCQTTNLSTVTSVTA